MSLPENYFWNIKDRAYECHPRMYSFVTEIEAICKKYGYSIGHEDNHGSFVIYNYDKDMASHFMKPTLFIDVKHE